MTISLSGISRATRFALSVLLATTLLAAAPRTMRAQPYPGDTVRPSVRASPWPERTPEVVTAGDTVRLFGTQSELVHGILVRADSDGFLVNPLHDRDTVRYSRESVRRADVRRGDRRRGVKALEVGSAIGAAVGAAFVTLGIAANDGHSDGISVIIGIFVGGVSFAAGTVVGGVVALTYTDQWIPFDPTSLRVLQEAR